MYLKGKRLNLLSNKCYLIRASIFILLFFFSSSLSRSDTVTEIKGMVKESYHHLTQQRHRHRHEIKGVVKDSKKLILPGVTVTLENLRDYSEVMAVTDERGVFEIKNLGPGEYQLTLELEGFETINQKVALIGEFALILDFQMKIAGYSEKIVVTATKTPEFLESVPVRVTLIPSREIEQKGAQNLMEALEGVPGVQVKTTCSICNAQEVRMCGMSGAHTQILIDGMPIISGLATIYGLSQIPAESIQQIEVIKGAGSALYGSDALAGVINIITKEVAPKPTLHALLNLGQFSTQTYRATFSGRYRRLGGSFSFQKASSDGVDANNDGITDMVAYDRDNLSAKVKFDISSKYSSALNFAVNYFGEERLGGPKGEVTETTENIITNRKEYYANWQIKPSDRSDLIVRATLSNHDQNALYESNWYKAQESIFVGEIQYNRLTGEKHLLTWGSMYKNQELLESARLGEVSSEQTGIYLQDQVNFSESLKLIAGGRFDSNTEFGNYFSPRGSLMYKPNKQLNFRISLGKGFKAPTVFFEEMHYCPGGFRYEMRRNPDIRPEKSTSLNFDAIYHPIKDHPDKLRLDFSLFRMDIIDLIQGKIVDVDDISGKLVHMYVNIGKARSQGAEANLSYEWTNYLSSLFTYTYLDARDLLQDNPLPFRPRHSATLLLRYDNPYSGWNFNLQGEFFGEMLTQEVLTGDIVRERHSPNYWLWDFRISKSFAQHYNIFFGIDNLFDYVQMDLGSEDTEYIWGPIRGRYFYTGIKVSF